MKYAIATVPLLLLTVSVAAGIRRVPFSVFAEGVKSGAQSLWSVFPSLMGFIPAIALLRASGLLDDLAILCAPLCRLGVPSELLPLILLRPVSGSGSVALLQEMLAQYGADSFVGRVSAVIAASTETTFYTASLYFGAASVRRTRHALPAAIAADFACIAGALLTVRLFFSS